MKISKLQLIYLAMLSMLGFVATDMYLPAFKALEESFATTPEPIALSLTLFLVGMALGQLVWGVASDRFGQRKTLMAGLTIFALASLGLAYSTAVWQLLLLRLIQAIGVCAPAVIWQAMVMQRYSARSQQIFATIMPLVALSPALAPQLGALLTDSFGWESIFIVLAFTGLILCLATYQQEDIKPVSSQSSVAGDIKTLVKSKRYLGNVLMYGMASAAFFAYLTGMPEIMAQLGYSPKDIGYSFIPQTIAFMAGGYLGKVCVAKFGDEKVLRNLLGLFTMASGMIFIASQWQINSIMPILAPFCLIAVANGALYPIVVNRALNAGSKSPATAAGLQNSIQICISSLASALVAVFASQAQMIAGVAIAITTIGLWVGFIVSHKELAEQFVIPDNARVVSDEE